jgi:hypothetical protein
VDDIAARMFDMFLLAGACLDVNGKGVALIAPPGTGGSTHLSALLRRPEVRLHSYDAFFVRRVSGAPVADSIERKLLMRTDLVSHLPELSRLYDRSKLENVVTRRDDCEMEGCPHAGECPLDRGETHCYFASKRSVAMLDPYWIGGAAKHVKRTVVTKVILLKRDAVAPKVQKPSTDAALRMIEEGGYSGGRGSYQQEPFYNPYQLVRTTDRMDLLRRHWKALLGSAPLVVINTEVMGLEEAKEAVWGEVGS